MHQIVKATYQDGVLKPEQDLALTDQQQVLIVVLPLRPDTPTRRPDPERVAALRERAAAWLAQQPADAVRAPLRLAEAQDRRLDEGFDAALAAIRSRADRFGPEEIAADIRREIAAAQALTPEEQAHLEAKLDALMTEWAADVE